MTAATAPQSSADSGAIESRLKELGIALPEAGTPPGALYLPYTKSGAQVFISGQLPLQNGELVAKGQLGDKVSPEQGIAAAKACSLLVLAHLKAACGGNLDKVKKALKLEILVSATPDFSEPHIIANGASTIMIEVFGEEKGKHARVAYGVASLPMDAAVEVAATFEIS